MGTCAWRQVLLRLSCWGFQGQLGARGCHPLREPHKPAEWWGGWGWGGVLGEPPWLACPEQQPRLQSSAFQAPGRCGGAAPASALADNTAAPDIHTGPGVGTPTKARMLSGLPLWGGEQRKGSWEREREEHRSPSTPWAQPQVLREGGQLPLRRCVFTFNLLLLLRTGSRTYHDTESPFSPQGDTTIQRGRSLPPLRAQTIVQVWGAGPEEGLAPSPPTYDFACPAETQPRV